MKKEIRLDPLSCFKDGDIVVPANFIINTNKCKNELIYAGSPFSLEVREMIDYKGEPVKQLKPFCAYLGKQTSPSRLFLLDHPKINHPDWEDSIGDDSSTYLFTKIGEIIELEYNNTRSFCYRSDFYIYNGKKYQAMKLFNNKIIYYRMDKKFPFVKLLIK